MTRKLDALVAERVMGLSEYRGRYANDYSTDIAAAWQVVEKMKLSLTPKKDDPRPQWKDGGWLADTELRGPQEPWLAVAPTAPLAICIAALRAVGVDAATINEAMGE